MTWDKTNKRFIAFFDIMGFKDLVQRTSHEEVYERLFTIKDFLNSYEAHDAKIKDLRYDESISTVKHLLFSDSILIVSAGESQNDLMHLIQRSNHFTWHCFNNGIPVKGAISHGIMTADFENSIFFGQPLIDVYLLQEELVIYGAVLDNNSERQLKKLEIKDPLFNGRFTPYDVPTKNGRIRHLCLKWLSKDSNGDIRPSNVSNVANFYNLVSGKPRIYVDNTIKFAEWVIDQHSKSDRSGN